MPEVNKTYIGKGRVEAFSDGVIAIIITLMILEIHLPKIDKSASSTETWAGLSALLPAIFTYMLSFLVAGIYWVNHHIFFHGVKHVDTRLLWYNLHFLFWLSLIPLPTAFLAEHYHKPEAMAFYGFEAFMCASSFVMMTRYAAFKADLLTVHVSKLQLKKLKMGNTFTLFLYFLSIFAGYYSIYISMFIFVLIPAIYFMPRILETDDDRKEFVD